MKKCLSCSKSLHILKLTCRVLLHFSVRETFYTVQRSMRTTNQKLQGIVWEIGVKDCT